jgi:hypothetical protein
MNSREYWGLMEAYSEVYAPEKEFQLWVNSLLEEGYDLSDYTWEDMYEAYIEERRGAAAGLANRNVFKPATTTSGPAGGGMGGMRGTGRYRNATQTSSSPGALRVSSAAKPDSNPSPTTPTPRPTTPTTTTTPTPRPTTTTTPTPRPTTTTTTPRPQVKPAPTTSGYKKDTSITDMIGRSQVRQGAPINTGNKSSDIRSMAARGSVGATPTTSAAKPSPTTRPMGSRKPGSIVSGLDMFDLVKGHLLDEGYADTEEAAIAIMANMSEEWKNTIINNL